MPSRRADAEHTYRPGGRVVKLMRSVGGNVQSVSGTYDRLLATECCLHLTLEQDRGLLEVVSMGWRPATWRDVHIDDTKLSIGILARHGDGVGITDQPNVREVAGLRDRQIAFSIVRWDRWLSSCHSVSP